MSDEITKKSRGFIIFLDRVDVCFRKSLFRIKRYNCFSQVQPEWSISVRRTEVIYFEFFY